MYTKFHSLKITFTTPYDDHQSIASVQPLDEEGNGISILQLEDSEATKLHDEIIHAMKEVIGANLPYWITL